MIQQPIKVDENNFHLLGSYPSDLMPDYFSCADVLLVSVLILFIFFL